MTAGAAAADGRPTAAVASPYLGYRVALWVYVAVFYLILYGPLVMIAVLSVNDSEISGFPFRGFSLRWYGTVFTSPQLIASLGNSFAVGALAALAATSMALLLALGFRHAFRAKSLVLNLILIPIVIPGITGGIVLLLSFGYLGVRPSLWTTVLIGHINWVLPFAFLTLYPRLHGFDHTLEEAAMDLGAQPWTIFTHIVFPLIRPGVVATLLFSFSLSFDEFIRTIFLTGFDRTIPVQFWTMLVNVVAPEITAMAVIIILISAFTALVGFACLRQARRGERGAAP